MQCVEACRARSYSYAIENNVELECHCSKVLDSNLVKLSPHSCNAARKYRVYEVAPQAQSPSCDHLYFTRSVFHWQSYLLENGLKVKCQYSKPSALVGTSWDQDFEKLARGGQYLAHTFPSD